MRGGKFGCALCSKMQRGTRFARFEVDPGKTQMSHMREHHTSAEHVKGSNRVVQDQSPSIDDFLTVLRSVHRAKSDNSELCHRHKRQAMVWCLAEAVGDRHRNWVRRAASICLAQDARQGVLMLRASVSTEDTLEVHKFLVGVRRPAGTDAYSVAECTKRILEDFCSPRKGRPAYGRRSGGLPQCGGLPHSSSGGLPQSGGLPHSSSGGLPQGGGLPLVARGGLPHDARGGLRLDAALWEKLCKATEAMVTDAASDELRAGRLIAGQSMSDLLTPLFTNLIFHAKDPTHASGRPLPMSPYVSLDYIGSEVSGCLPLPHPPTPARLLKEWKADPFLAATFDFFIGGASSITRLIQNSPDITRIFSLKVQGLDDDEGRVSGTAIRNMRYAKQRFNSAQSPLSRVVLFLPALVATASEVAIVRQGTKPAKVALAFLEGLTVEKAVQAAMMADAAQETLLITRAFDTEEYDLARVPSAIHAYVKTLEYLFLQSPPGCEETGYAAFAINALKTPLVFHASGRQLKSVGGHSVDRTTLARCVARMACWVRLAIQRVGFEFPQWLPVHSFCVFDLGRKSDVYGGDQHENECFQRLGRLLQLDPVQLQDEFKHCQHYASVHFQEKGGHGNSAAWAAALRKRGVSANSCLRKAVHILQTWDGMTTSGVEQTFSKAEAMGSRREQLTEDHLTQELLGMCTAQDGPHELQALAKSAQCVWGNHWGAPRVSGAKRQRHFSRRHPSDDVAACPTDAAACPADAAACPADAVACPADAVACPADAVACPADAVACPADSAGQPRKKRLTAAAWVRGRNARVAKRVASMADNRREAILERAVGVSALAWGESHENAHQALQERLVALQGICAARPVSAVLPEELDDDTRAAGALALAALERLDREHDRKKHLQLRRLRTPRPLTLAGLNICLATSLGQRDDLIRAAIAGNASLLTGTRLPEVDLFIVNNPAEPGQHAQLVAGLRGGSIANPQYVMSSGRNGFCVQFRNALRVKRGIWVSEECCTKYPTLVRLLRQCMRSDRAAQWKEVSLQSFATFQAAQLDKPARLRRLMDQIAVVSAAEKRQEVLY